MRTLIMIFIAAVQLTSFTNFIVLDVANIAYERHQDYMQPSVTLLI